VDAHYFRGRLRAQDADGRDLLFKERVFDDILTRQGITNHYLPIGPSGEKGIDVWLALEAYELAIHKRFDVTVLIAGDGDFLPLVRKLNTIGTRVMLLAWDFKFIDRNNSERETKTSQSLLEEVTYPVLMHQIIDDRSLRNDQFINGLFVRKNEYSVRTMMVSAPEAAPQASVFVPAAVTDDVEPRQGRIQNLKEGFGFITPLEGGQNLFFFHAEVWNAEFNELHIGDMVEYQLGKNDKGPCAVKIRTMEEGEDSRGAAD
jgi:cold shock CspA family protein